MSLSCASTRGSYSRIDGVTLQLYELGIEAANGDEKVMAN